MSINKPYSPDKTIFYMETGRRIWRIGHSLFLPGWIWWDPQLLPPGTILDMMERTSTATTRLAGYRYVDQSLVEWCCRYHVGLRHVTNWIAGSHFGAELMSTEKETTLTKLLLVITAILLISVTSSPSDLVSTPEPKYLCKSRLTTRKLIPIFIVGRLTFSALLFCLVVSTTRAGRGCWWLSSLFITNICMARPISNSGVVLYLAPPHPLPAYTQHSYFQRVSLGRNRTPSSHGEDKSQELFFFVDQAIGSTTNGLISFSVIVQMALLRRG